MYLTESCKTSERRFTEDTTYIKQNTGDREKT